MVHAGGHGEDGFAIGKAEDRDLRAGEEFLDDDFAAAFAEDLFLHHRADGVFCFLAGMADEDSFAQGQAAGLDHDGEGGLGHTGQGGGGVMEHLVIRGGDAVPFHQVLSEGFAALDGGGGGVRAKGGDACFPEFIHSAQHQGVVGGHHHKVGLVFLGCCNDGLHIVGAAGDTDGILGDTGVAGHSKQLGGPGAFLQLTDNCVFPAAAANDQYSHGILSCTYVLLLFPS